MIDHSFEHPEIPCYSPSYPPFLFSSPARLELSHHNTLFDVRLVWPPIDMVKTKSVVWRPLVVVDNVV